MPTDTPLKSISATGIELFRAGKQRDSQGMVRQWSAADLDEMAASYNACAGSLHDAPIQVGHDPNTAYGWLERAYRDGDVLKGDYKEVDPEFVEAVNAGRYKKRSISIYPPDHNDNPTPGKLNIRHVGYVGIPAVKGLLDHKFNDSGEGFWEYAAGDADMVTTSTKDKTASSTSFKNAKEFLAAWSAADSMDDPDSEKAQLIAAAKKIKLKLPTAAMKWAQDNATAMDMAEPAETAAFAAIATVMQGLRDRLIKSDGIDAAEQSIPQALLNQIREGDDDARPSIGSPPDAIQTAIMNRLDMLTQNMMGLQAALAAQPATSMPGANYAEKEDAMTGAKTTTPEATTETVDFAAQISELQQKQTALETENVQLKAQVAVLTESRANLAAERERDRITSFVENLASNDQRKLLPADVKATIELALAMPNDNPQDFSEGDATVSATPRQRYLDRLAEGKALWNNKPMGTGPEHAPPENAIVNFNAAPGYTVDQESAQLHNQAVAYCQKQGWDYKEEEKYTAALVAITDGAN